MRNRLFEILARLALCLFVVLAAGCASSGNTQTAQTVIQPPPLFPPQTVIKSGDYAGFLTQNQETLKSCQEPEQCAAALFNVAFLYSYPRSPYYDPARGIKYLDDLMKGAPGSPWAYQAMVWSDLLKKNLKKETRKPKLKEEAKPREAAAEESVQQGEAAIESVPVVDLQQQEPETDRQALEEEIKAKDATIKELNRRIERSRQIDIEIEKKERGLLF